MLFVGAASAALCQEIPIDIIDRVNAVDYIFEGKVIASTPYKTANGKYIYTSNTIQITKILKGDLSCGTVELITDGGMVDDLRLDVSHSLDLHKDCSGIFLAKGTSKELSAVDFYEETNLPKIEATFQDQSFIKYWHDGVDWRVSDMWTNFDSLAQVYNLAELITGLNFVDCDAPAIFGGGWEREARVRGSEPVMLRPDLDTIRQRLAEIAAKRLQIQPHARGDALGEVTYSMTNVEVTGTDPLYLEFDVNINDDMGTKYLYWAGARVVYDTLVFGSNIGQTSNMDMTNGDLISDLNCYGYSYPIDLESNSYVAFAYPAFQSQCLAVVPTAPVPLFHIRMKILDCPASTITLVDSAFYDGPSAVLYYTAWSETEVADDIFDYATANIDQTEEIEACGPRITSFSPTTVAGGIQDILQIHGHGFGASRGTGTVFFKNADDGGGSEVACDAADFLLLGGWSDELIRLYVPSADTATIGSTTTPDSPAGTGTFRVVTDMGISIPSVDTLTITYSVSSYDGAMPKPPALLGPRAIFEGKYAFHIDSLIAIYDDGAMIPVIKKALREWTCLTGVDWAVIDDSVYHSLPDAERDSLCVINFGALTPGKVAETTRYLSLCDNNFYVLESDIIINNDTELIWFLDTIPEHPIPDGQTDLYHVLLHELGHAHNLKHVLAPEQIMYYSDNSSGAFRKIELFADASAYEGGNWVMDESYLTPPAAGCAISPISISTAPLCAGFYSIAEIPTPSNVLLHPNPFNGFLRATSLEGRIRTVQVFNSLGAVVFRFVQQPSMSAVLDLSTLERGLYLVNVQFDNHTSITVKAIKEE